MEQNNPQQYGIKINPAVIHSVLISLGITPNYRGFIQTEYAVQAAVQCPESLGLVTKMLFPKVAKHFNTSWTSVERNIRTVSDIAWQNNPQLFSVLSGNRLTERPTSKMFISILVYHCLKLQRLSMEKSARGGNYLDEDGSGDEYLQMVKREYQPL